MDPKVYENWDPKFLPSETVVVLDPKVDKNLDPKFSPSETVVVLDRHVDKMLVKLCTLSDKGITMVKISCVYMPPSPAPRRGRHILGSIPHSQNPRIQKKKNNTFPQNISEKLFPSESFASK